MIRSLCVLGGGTAGLISALMMRKAYPTLKITILESSKIGIIGVGEGSTEHWKPFMEYIDVDVPTIVRECGSTFKIGIKFTNWNGDGKSYWHSLTEQYNTLHQDNDAPLSWFRYTGENWDPEETAWDLSRNSKHPEPFHEIISQYHFDTFKLNKFFHKLCAERNIEVIDTDISDVIVDKDGYADYLIDEHGKQYKADFYIDSSGFRRIISSKLGAKWVDKQKQLPMNSAIAFPTGYTENIPYYTEATALSSGWVWRIPTQERYGNGYVFCDNFINETQAYDEVSKHYKENLKITQELEIGRKVKFSAGYLDKFWIKNCLTVGLSGMFVEPLEASSIGSTIQEIRLAIPSFHYWTRGETITENVFNDRMIRIAENIVDFIQLHYITKRNDTEFWKWVNKEIVYTDFIRENLEYFKKNGVNSQMFGIEPLYMFSYLNWSQVMHGLSLFDYDARKKYWEEFWSKEHSENLDNLFKHGNAVDMSTVRTHREALNILKERYLEVRYEL